jgi:hypothetical protein
MAETRWALMKVQRIMDTHEPDKVYLWRLRVFTTPWCSLKLHHIMMPDNDRHLHDHPWNFHSLILAGGYTEELGYTPPGYVQPVRNVNRWHWSHKRAEDAHRIAQFHNRKDTWSLVFCGRLRRRWGFHTENGWVDHEPYLEKRDNA